MPRNVCTAVGVCSIRLVGSAHNTASFSSTLFRRFRIFFVRGLCGPTTNLPEGPRQVVLYSAIVGATAVQLSPPAEDALEEDYWGLRYLATI